MRIIKIINGTYGYKPQNGKCVMPVSCGDPNISVADSEAERLVNLGIAVYVNEDNNAAAVATAIPAPLDNNPIANIPVNENGDKGLGEAETTKAHLDADQLKTVSNANLKKMAEEMGIDTDGMKTKADYIAAITAVEVEVDGMPDLKAEDVVE